MLLTMGPLTTTQIILGVLLLFATLVFTGVVKLQSFSRRLFEPLAIKPKPANTQRTYRIQGVPNDWDKEQLRLFLIQVEVSEFPIIKSLAQEAHRRSSTATVVFQEPPKLLKVPLREKTMPVRPERQMCLEVDTQFFGLTTLYFPLPEDHQIE
jgi:hypothetical protein